MNNLLKMEKVVYGGDRDRTGWVSNRNRCIVAPNRNQRVADELNELFMSKIDDLKKCHHRSEVVNTTLLVKFTIASFMGILLLLVVPLTDPQNLIWIVVSLICLLAWLPGLIGYFILHDRNLGATYRGLRGIDAEIKDNRHQLSKWQYGVLWVKLRQFEESLNNQGAELFGSSLKRLSVSLID